jgi:hypothetical protein
MTAARQGKWYWRLDYLGFSAGCAVAWAVVWILLATMASTHTVHTMAYVFLGLGHRVHHGHTRQSRIPRAEVDGVRPGTARLGVL